MGSKRNLLATRGQKKSAEDYERLCREIANLRGAVQELSSLIKQYSSTSVSIPVNANGYVMWIKGKDIAYAFLGSARPGEGYKAGTLYVVTDQGTFPTLYRSIRGLKKRWTTASSPRTRDSSSTVSGWGLSHWTNCCAPKE